MLISHHILQSSLRLVFKEGDVIVPALVILAVEVWTEFCTCVVKHGGHVALIRELNLRIYTISEILCWL